MGQEPTDPWWCGSMIKKIVEGMQISAFISALVLSILGKPYFSGCFVLLKIVHISFTLMWWSLFNLWAERQNKYDAFPPKIFTIAMAGWHVSTALTICRWHTYFNGSSQHHYLFFLKLFHTSKLIIPLLVHLQKLQLSGSHSKHPSFQHCQ